MKQEDNAIKFYRYEEKEYANFDHDGEYVSPSIPRPKVELLEFNLFSETPKGYWIGYGGFEGLRGHKKWIGKTAKKRYAHPTKKEALQSFIKRKEKQVKILKYQLMSAEFALSTAKNMEKL